MDHSVKRVLQAKKTSLDETFIVHRSLPQAGLRMVGPFIFWDHMGPAEISSKNNLTVRAHPHIGLSTITYLFSGEIVHRDSLGNELVIRPGEVNWMTAGSGIAHSERSPQNLQPHTLEGLQVWVALPTQSEDVAPSFVHQKESDLPLIDHQGCQLRLIAGQALGSVSPLPVYSPLFYLRGETEGLADVTFPIGENEEGAVYIVEGEVEVGDTTYQKFDMVVFNTGADLQFRCPSACTFMILGGQPFPEGRHIWWNFVSHDAGKIEAAKKRWQQRTFDPVINEDEFIELP